MNYFNNNVILCLDSCMASTRIETKQALYRLILFLYDEISIDSMEYSIYREVDMIEGHLLECVRKSLDICRIVSFRTRDADSSRLMDGDELVIALMDLHDG